MEQDISIKKDCVSCNKPFVIDQSDLSFLKKISPSYAGKSFFIPPPTHCPACRLQRRLSYRNEYVYYSRKCDLCEKSIVSIHSPANPYPVYCHSCWWSENWEPTTYGQDYDPSKSFFEQFHTLQNKVPQIAMMNDNGVNSENCEYCQDFSFGKNCYLVTASWEVQDCAYCSQSNKNKQIYDCFLVNKSELSYECIVGHQLYACSELTLCSGCTECHFGLDLRECKNCVGCVGLRQKQFCIFNQQLSEIAYWKEFHSLSLSSRSSREKLRQKFDQFSIQFPQKAIHQLNCENCQGDSLSHCRNFEGYGVFNGEDSKYIWQGDTPKNCYDLQVTGKAEWCYEGGTVDNSYMTHFSTWTWYDKNTLYSDNCHSSENLLGCISLKRKKHCILNRQYSLSEYEALAAQILSDMNASMEFGEFFPMKNSPFSYNETRAQDVFPLNQTTASQLLLRWKDEDRKSYKPTNELVPDDISQVKDSLLRSLLACTKCQRNFKINQLELGFYKDSKIPIPEYCPDCRRNARFARRPSTGTLSSNYCTKCNEAIKSIYEPQSRIQVLCEKCYLERIY